jgi:hypothetical protein
MSNAGAFTRFGVRQLPLNQGWAGAGSSHRRGLQKHDPEAGVAQFHAGVREDSALAAGGPAQLVEPLNGELVSDPLGISASGPAKHGDIFSDSWVHLGKEVKERKM